MGSRERAEFFHHTVTLKSRVVAGIGHRIECNPLAGAELGTRHSKTWDGPAILGYSLLMSATAACDLCGQPQHLEVYDLSLCQGCHDRPGQAPGISLELKHERRPSVDQLPATLIHDIHIRVPRAQAAQITVKFTHEGMGAKLIKVFKSEYQAGDAAFDDAIYIADAHRPSTEELLARPGARAAILTLVGERNRVKIEAGTIEFSAHDDDDSSLLDYLRAAIALSRHIDAIV